MGPEIEMMAPPASQAVDLEIIAEGRLAGTGRSDEEDGWDAVVHRCRGLYQSGGEPDKGLMIRDETGFWGSLF